MAWEYCHCTGVNKRSYSIVGKNNDIGDPFAYIINVSSEVCRVFCVLSVAELSFFGT